MTVLGCILVPLMIVLQQSLLTLWITLVTVQLIAHLALVDSMAPPKVVHFMRGLLNFTRLIINEEPDPDGNALN